MRILHEASAVFLVVDDLTSQPLKDAAVYCAAAGRSGTRCADGYHVFSGLPPGGHVFAVSRPGYAPRSVTAPCTGEEGRRVRAVRLCWSQMHPELRRHRHLLFLLSDSGGALAGKEVSIALSTPSPSLRLVEDAAQGDALLVLNTRPKAALLERELLDEGGGSHFFTGLAPEERAYRLDGPLERALRAGERLLPVWRVETDREGAAVLPIHPLLMPLGPLSFSVSWDGRTQTAEVEPFLENERRVPVRFETGGN